MMRFLKPTACAIALAIALGGVAGCGTSGAASTDSSAAENSAPAVAAQSEEAPSGASALSATPATSTGAAPTTFENIPSDASASRAAESAGESKLGKALAADIKPIVKAAGMDVEVTIVDPASGTHVAANADRRMVSASMIKLAIAASLLEHAEAGSLSLDDTCTVSESDIVGGTGSLGGRGAGAETTFGELLKLMIAESDNTATNIIVDKLGMKAINDTAKRLELTSTELKRKMMDEEAIAQGVENYTSANDVARILELAYDGELVNKRASKTLLEALRAQVDDVGIKAGLPSEATFAHKTGSLGTVQHDGGIVECGHDFIVVVMCGGAGFSYDGALETMADVAKAVYDDIV